MGYRSHVTMLMYGYERDFPMLKLWVEENMRPVLDEHWKEGDCFREEVFERGRFKGYAFEFADIKWYESYPDVDAVEKAWEKFDELFDNIEEGSLILAGERARVGEDYSDVEYAETRHAENLLSIVRHAEY